MRKLCKCKMNFKLYNASLNYIKTYLNFFEYKSRFFEIDKW